MRGVSGVSGAAPIWNSVMRFIHHGVVVNSVRRRVPDNVVVQPITFTGVTEPDRTELFLAGTQAKEIRLVSNVNRATALIAFPAEGAIYAIDPDIPMKRQKLRFTASAATPLSAQWRLNDKPLSARSLSAGTRLHHPSWTLIAGKHTLAIHDKNGNMLEQVKFEVRSPYR
jgi:penicillin-binding protein 1C